MTKQDIFYYAKANGIPCYYQPETEEIIPQNKLCELLMDIQLWFWNIFGTPEQFKIVIYHKAIIRQKIEKAMQFTILKTKKENARLKADYKGLYKLREEENKGISKKIAELEAQIEKMKCCGNCIHCKYDENQESYEFCEKHQQVVNIAIVPCSEWKWR